MFENQITNQQISVPDTIKRLQKNRPLLPANILGITRIVVKV